MIDADTIRAMQIAEQMGVKWRPEASVSSAMADPFGGDVTPAPAGIPASWGPSMPGLEERIQAGAAMSPFGNLLDALGILDQVKTQSTAGRAMDVMGLFGAAPQMAEIPITPKLPSGANRGLISSITEQEGSAMTTKNGDITTKATPKPEVGKTYRIWKDGKFQHWEENIDSEAAADNLLRQSEKYGLEIREIRREPEKKPWQRTREDYVGEPGPSERDKHRWRGRVSEHEEMIAQAVADGESVPQHVLKDYPGITKKAAEIIKTRSETPEGLFLTSKVLDRDGNLKKVYHGTGQDIKKLDYSKAIQTANPHVKGDNDFGTFFTDIKDEAIFYAKGGHYGKAGNKPKVFEVYLNIERPFDVTDTQHLISMYPGLSVPQIKERLIKSGYDGIHIHSRGSGSPVNWYVPFRNEQIHYIKRGKKESDPNPSRPPESGGNEFDELVKKARKIK